MSKLSKQTNHNKHISRSAISTSVSFNSFSFVDNLTNSKIMLKDAHEHYHKKMKKRPSQIQQKKKQVEGLNSCVNLLKTTKLFQMDSLRCKLFKSAHHSHHQGGNDQLEMEEAKKGLKKLIESSIEEINRKQFRQFISDSKHINPQVMRLQSLSRQKLTKTNLLRLMSTNLPRNQSRKLKQMKLDDTSFEVKQLQDLKQKTEHYLSSIRNNNAYLIKPDQKHELYQQLYQACSSKNKQHTQQTNSRSGSGNQGVFKPATIGEKAKAIESKNNGKENPLKPQQQEILYAVQNNLFFDLQFLLNTRKSLVHCKDKKGKEQRTQRQIQLGKTPLDLAKLYGVSGIIRSIQNYSPFG